MVELLTIGRQQKKQGKTCRIKYDKKFNTSDENIGYVYVHAFSDGCIYVGSTTVRPTDRYSKKYHNEVVEHNMRFLDRYTIIYVYRFDTKRELLELEQKMLDSMKENVNELVLNKQNAIAKDKKD